MTSIPVHELKSRLSYYLRRARAGQRIEVTSHREVVARITGVPAEVTGGLASLIASGAASWSGGKPAGAAIRLPTKRPALSEQVLEDRA